MRKPAYAETKTDISYVASTLISVLFAFGFIVSVVSAKFQAS